MLNYSTLQRYHEDLGWTIESATDVDEVCQYVERHSEGRKLSDAGIKAINQLIKAIPTGRQRRLKRARDQVLQYLYDVCDWSLPQRQEQKYHDRALDWMYQIQALNHDAGTLLQGYQIQRQRFLRERKSENELAWLLTVLYIEVAPMPLRYWQAVLISDNPIEFFEGQYTLRVPHPVPIAAFASHNQPSFTRLPLPLFAYRLLQQYLLQSPQEPSSKVLLNALINAFSAQPYYLKPRTAAMWQRTLQSLWHHHYQVPAQLLRDISEPDRHVATLPYTFRKELPTSVKDSLYQPVLFSTQKFQDIKKSNTKARYWPHKGLIKYHRRKNSKPEMSIPKAPDWDQDNVFPKLLFHFCESLFINGGIKRDNLPADTVDRYTNFYKNLDPLPYHAACTPEKLAHWAHLSLKKLNTKDSQAWHFYQFLRSVAQQPLTDHLDLSQFEKPSLPTCVDPFRLSVSQLHQVIEHLLSSTNGHSLQRLFSSVAAVLGFYAALRRSEVLRLRVGNIRQIAHHNNRFQLIITGTQEGRTKSRQTRHVNIILPEVLAKLLRVVIKMHESSDKTQPLLALFGESMASRASHYLYPVTQVLKGMFGPQVRFHHLRHSGIELTYLQGLHLAYERKEDHLEALLNDNAMQMMLTKQHCLARFDFWLEGRDFTEINDSLLLDVICAQFGHTHYATTRRHYLHGLERIIPLFKPKMRHYSRNELRYIFGMKIGSNDITRVLSELSPEYAALPEDRKKSYQPYFSEAQLNKKIAPKSTVSTPKQYWHDDAFLTIWARNTPKQWYKEETFYLMNGNTMRMLSAGELTITALSQAWQELGQHQGLMLDKKQRAALKQLGPPTISKAMDNDGTSTHHEPNTLDILFNCRCNQRTLMAFEILCHQGPFKSFNATLNLIQNRKSLYSNKLDLINNHFARKHDCVQHNIIPDGKTSLCITLHTQLSFEAFHQPLEQYFIDLFSNTV